MEGDTERWRIHRELDAGQLCDVDRHIRYHWLGFGRIHRVAHSTRVERADHDRVFGEDEILEPIEEIDAAPAYCTT